MTSNAMLWWDSWANGGGEWTVTIQDVNEAREPVEREIAADVDPRIEPSLDKDMAHFCHVDEETGAVTCLDLLGETFGAVTGPDGSGIQVGTIEKAEPEPIDGVFKPDALIAVAKEMAGWLRSHTGPADGTHEMLVRAVDVIREFDPEYPRPGE